MSGLSSLCVYCASSDGADPAHRETARRLGQLLAEHGVRLVYGGGRVGLMGIVADAVLAAGGKVTGVIPYHLEAREVGHKDVTELIVVDSMHGRKHRMFELADAFAVLPGGLGTLDETIEIITWRQLGLHDKPIVLIDDDGYWAPLFDLVDHAIAKGFASKETKRLYSVVGHVDDVFEAIAAAGAPGAPSRGDLF
jgi:uncharacterized protein (TIGR00730 family)